jgi:hypothetical protein
MTREEIDQAYTLLLRRCIGDDRLCGALQALVAGLRESLAEAARLRAENEQLREEALDVRVSFDALT